MECDVIESDIVSESSVSIHAPLVECDLNELAPSSASCEFLSTHPSWSATVADLQTLQDITVSIHAPLVECD